MNTRGPPQGAPFNFTNGETLNEIGNKFVYLTVEYAEDQTRDYNRMFSSFEPIPFSFMASSPLSDFEHRVSPHDPNMSSTARYSPTPVQLPPSPYQDSVVILQESSLPLISTSEPTTQPIVNYTPQLSESTAPKNIPPSDNNADFDDGSDETNIKSCVEEELILMPGTNTNIETTTTSSMLNEIPSPDFTLTRDLLVMQDEQISIVNSPRTTSSELNTQQNILVSEISSISVLQEPDAKFVNKSQGNKTTSSDEFRYKNLQKRNNNPNNNNDSHEKPFWCYERGNICINGGGSLPHNIRAIADQPVPARAIATLPNSYLAIMKLPPSKSSEKGLDYGIFARRTIKKRTQFGPVEGVLSDYDGSQMNKNDLPLLFENKNGNILRVDVSNENASNWMRFVRPAKKYEEQNLVICQQNDGIVFLTVRDIMAKEELRAGPHPDYARRRNLPFLTPADNQAKELKNKDIQFSLCSKNNLHTLTDLKLDQCLKINGKKVENSKSNQKKDKHTSKKFFKVVDGQTLVYSCPHCLKVFPRNYSLKRHLLIHPDAKLPNYECSKCNESFLYAHILNRHLKTCHSASTKEKENSRQTPNEWKCSFCSLAFRKMSLLELHLFSHPPKKDDVSKATFCPECDIVFNKPNELVVHVAQHGILSSKKNENNLALFKCSRCYKRFATRTRLQQHCLVHGANEQKPLPCDFCLKRFMNKSALSCHLKTHKKEKQTFECPMCQKQFKQILFLRDHVQTHRNDDNTFDCPYCLRNFIKYSVIRKHIRAHHCERTHKCQFCVKRFSTVDKLRMHSLRHSDYKAFHCANCDKQFKRKDKLKEHITRMHIAERINKDGTLQRNQTKKFVPKVNPMDYNRFVYKCHQCLVGFKRRGMLVNHLAKRHPEVSPDSVPELNLPILRQTRDYFCQYCDKVYKSSSKRKAHIMKNHPGAALPPSNRQKDSDIPGLSNSSFSQTVGSITTIPQGCQWCHKQYASKAKLLQHQRKKHTTLMEPADQIPRPRNRASHNQNVRVLTDNTIIVDYIQGSHDFLEQRMKKNNDKTNFTSESTGLR